MAVWQVAQSQEGRAKTTTTNHAALWYGKALPGLSGISRTRVLARLKEFTKPPPIPATIKGLAQPAADCRKMAHEIAKVMPASFDPGKDWMIFVEARIPTFQPGHHQLVIWGDDRAGQDPICLMLDGNKLYGSVDDCRTNKREWVTKELPVSLAGKWLKIAFVYRSAASTLQLFVNDKLEAESRCSFQPNFDLGMPVRLGGVSNDSQRFRGELRSIVISNVP